MSFCLHTILIFLQPAGDILSPFILGFVFQGKKKAKFDTWKYCGKLGNFQLWVKNQWKIFKIHLKYPLVGKGLYPRLKINRQNNL